MRQGRGEEMNLVGSEGQGSSKHAGRADVEVDAIGIRVIEVVVVVEAHTNLQEKAMKNSIRA